MYAKKSVSMKVVVLLLAVVLVFGCVVGGTLAWLIASTNTVTNTFTVGDIDIDLTETVNGQSQSALTSAVTNDGFKMIPGTDLAKDPMVTVQANSEACWLFIQVTAANGVVHTNDEGIYNAVADYITYTMADGWTAVPNHAGVYYRQVSASTEAQPFEILKDNEVHVLDTVTKAMMATAETTKPSLAFTAYAIQSEGLTDASGTAVTDAAAAWTLVGSN